MLPLAEAAGLLQVALGRLVWSRTALASFIGPYPLC